MHYSYRCVSIPTYGSDSCRIVLSNIGTLGDINPLIALALELNGAALASDGAAKCISTRLEPLGLEFHAIRPDIDPTNNVLVEMVLRHQARHEHGLRDFLFPSLRQTYDDLWMR